MARASERVELSDDAVARMRERRVVVERASREGTPTYGVTTGVGMRRGADVSASDATAFNRSAISGHLVGLGPPAADDVVRAALLCHANALAAGYQGARPEIALAYVGALNDSNVPRVSSLGTVGQSDLALNADLAHGVLGELELEAGEALALLNGNAFSTGHAALAVADASALVRWIDAAAALDFEAFRGERRRAASGGRGRAATRRVSARRSRGSTRCSTGARSGSPEQLASSRIR